MDELVEDSSVFHVFLYGNDFHNLKAAIKESFRKTSFPGIYVGHGTLSSEEIKEAVANNRFQELPERMREPAREAYQTLLHTHDGQLCDVILDRRPWRRSTRRERNPETNFLALYGELTVASRDIKTAFRAVRTGKSEEFLRRAPGSLRHPETSGADPGVEGRTSGAGRLSGNHLLPGGSQGAALFSLDF